MRWLTVAVIFTVSAQAQVVLSVPSSTYPTIQSAINAASNGDVVGVGPGTYVENIDFLGKSITVLGAGSDVCTIDGGQAGACVVFQNNEMGAVLEGFTLTNGSGILRLPPSMPTFTLGGAISVWGPGYWLNPIMNPTVRDCLITANTAYDGAGAGIENFGGLILEGCDIRHNVAQIGGGLYQGLGRLTLRACRITENLALGKGGGGGAISNPVTITDCVISDNEVRPTNGQYSFGAGLATNGGRGVATIERCRIERNVINTGTTGVVGYGGGIAGNGDLLLNEVLIADNRADIGGAFFSGSACAPFTNCTIVGNTSTGGAGVLDFSNSVLTMVNSIVWGNAPSVLTTNQFIVLGFDTNDLQPGFTPPVGTGNFSAPPRFVDAKRGDYHLRGDSPCVDAGNAGAVNLGTADFEGDPRAVYAAPDVGADEMADASRDPAAAGSVGVAGGGAARPVLRVAGRTGGPARRVTVRAGAPFAVSMSRPAASPGPAKFAIYGLLRAARFDDVTALPGGIGAMTFAPCPLLPSLQPTLFTLTDNLASTPCGQLLASTPAPWTGPGINIPVPFTFTLQGLIEETPGVLRTTNAIIVDVR